MRLAIISLNLHCNIGGILQAYALQTTLERMGNEAINVNNYDFKEIPKWKLGILLVKGLIRKVLRRRGASLANYLEIKAKNPFVKKYLKLQTPQDFDAIKQGDFDGFVVGSDQVWRPNYFNRPSHPHNISNAYLAFSDGWANTKRVAYAASFGVSEWTYTPDDTRLCAAAAKQFDAISVREDSAVTLCEQHLGVHAQHVVDPTMLLNADDYRQLFSSDNSTSQGQPLFCYILDQSKQKSSLVKHVAAENGRNYSYISGGTNFLRPIRKETRFASIQQWLRCFNDAQFVITDSFHGTVFSIIFNKPFVVLTNSGRGNARMESLLRMFDMSDRLITDHANPDLTTVNRLLHTPLSTSSRLAELRAQGLDFLSQALSL